MIEIAALERPDRVRQGETVVARIAVQERRLDVVPENIVRQFEAQLLAVPLHRRIGILAREYDVTEPEVARVVAVHAAGRRKRRGVLFRAEKYFIAHAIRPRHHDQLHHCPLAAQRGFTGFYREPARGQIPGEFAQRFARLDLPADVQQAVVVGVVECEAVVIVVEAVLVQARG